MLALVQVAPPLRLLCTIDAKYRSGSPRSLGEEEISDVSLATFYVFDKAQTPAHSSPLFSLPEVEVAAVATVVVVVAEAAVVAVAEVAGAFC